VQIAARKAAARRAALARRKAAQDAGAARRANECLLELLAPHLGRPVSGYMPIRTEIDPRPAMRELARHGPVGVPVIQGPGLPLEFHRWTPEAEMRKGPFGAPVPARAEPLEPGVVILPLVAFDARGCRLGYGGGFYDRTLERLRACRPLLAVGLAYAAQQADELPVEDTDQPMDAVVTEAGATWFGPDPLAAFL